MLDTSTEAGAHARERLEREEIIWLSTVRPDGQPQSVPVWFLWDGETFLIYSQPDVPKIRNIRGNPRVALSLNTDPGGEDVVRVEGTAALDADGPPVTSVPAYVEKYRAGIARIGSTPEAMAEGYSTAIRVTPTRYR